MHFTTNLLHFFNIQTDVIVIICTILATATTPATKTSTDIATTATTLCSSTIFTG